MKLARSICLCLFLFVSLIGPGGSPAMAQGPQPLETAPFTGGTPYWLVLPLQNTSRMDLPAHLTRDQASRYAQTLFSIQAEPILGQLSPLQNAGLVSNVTLDPQKHAISLEINSPDAIEQVKAIAANGRLLEQSSANTACAQNVARAFNQKVLALSRPAVQSQSTSGATTIDVYAPYQGNWTDVEGNTAPNTAVSMRIQRGTKVVWTETGASDAQGYYSFSPEWTYSCSTVSALTWKVIPGDVVEITAGGARVSTVVAKVTAWVDPVRNIVAGETDANRKVTVFLHSLASNVCDIEGRVTDLSHRPHDGKFSIDFTDEVDFNRLALALVYSEDANGNSTYTDPLAFHLALSADSTEVYGTLKPITVYTATLERGGEIISTIAGTTNYWGDFGNQFSQESGSTYQAGDVIWATDGANTVSMTFASFSASVQANTDQITGTVKFGWNVFAWVYRQAMRDFLNGCQDVRTSCKSAAVDGAGNFTISYAGTYNILPGDFVGLDAFDKEGNIEYGVWSSYPALFADLSANTITGLWVTPDTDLTISVVKKDGQHEDIPTHTSENDSFFGGGPQTLLLASGDTITVKDDTHTETMTVGDLSGTFSPASKRLTGKASNTRLVAGMIDFDRSQQLSTYRCAETTVSGGAFNLDFSEASIVGPQDFVFLSSTGPDDHHYTLLEVNVAGIDVFDGTNFSGYIPASGDSFTLEVQQPDGTLITAGPTMTSSPVGGHFYWRVVDPLLPGQQVLLKNGAGEVVARVSMPALSVNLDLASERVYGQGPKNDPVTIQLYEETWYGSAYLQALSITIDGSGNYNLTYAGPTSDCIQGSCPYAMLEYYDQRENRITIASDLPAPVGKDSFEPDDTIEAASPFVPGDVHTFDTSADVDWVSLTFDETQVGNPYTLKTVDAGLAARVAFTVYGPDRTTVVDSNTLFGFEDTRISFTPAVPGTYYLEMAPENPALTAGKCGSYYAVSFSYDLVFALIFKH